MSDSETRALERALRRCGSFRFVAIVSRFIPEGGERVTLIACCGPHGENLARMHAWAMPVYMLEDLTVIEDMGRPVTPDGFKPLHGLFDLCRRRVVFSNDFSFNELEAGWTDDNFERPGILRERYLHEKEA